MNGQFFTKHVNFIDGTMVCFRIWFSFVYWQVFSVMTAAPDVLIEKYIAYRDVIEGAMLKLIEEG